MAKKAKVVPIEKSESNPSEEYVSVEAKISKEFGPVKKRKCRDFVFLILYLAFLVGMVIVGVTAFNNGNWANI
jgi:cell division septal protein FtsQ